MAKSKIPLSLVAHRNLWHSRGFAFPGSDSESFEGRAQGLCFHHISHP